MTIATPATPDVEAPADALTKIRELLTRLISTGTAYDVLELAMAVAISQRVVPHGPPVWLLLEGPPSSGKTSLVDLLKNLAATPAPLAVYVPKVTLGSLTGGYKDPRGGKRAPALLASFDTRCWVNSEFSTLLTGRPETVSPILGVLTAAFEGDFAAAFGNVTERDSPILNVQSRFSVLGCITPQVRQQHTRLLAQLGPRFLSYRPLPLTDDERDRAFALVAEPDRAARLKELQGLVGAHVRGALRRTATIPDENDQVLRTLSQFVAAGRTPVDSHDDSLTVVGGEDPIRAYQQLRALAVALACVHGTAIPNARAMRIVRDVALSSLEPRRAEAITAQRVNPVPLVRLADGGPPLWVHGMTAGRLADETGWDKATASRVLKELTAVGLYGKIGADFGFLSLDTRRGSEPDLYLPTLALHSLLSARFEVYPPVPVLLPQMFFRGGDDLSPADARLSGSLEGGRAELRERLDGAARQLLADPANAGDDRLARVIEEALKT